jgi:hypothetical protein
MNLFKHGAVIFTNRAFATTELTRFFTAATTIVLLKLLCETDRQRQGSAELKTADLLCLYVVYTVHFNIIIKYKPTKFTPEF